MQQHRLAEPVYVTRPAMPEKAAVSDHLDTVWESRWLTNEGALHDRLEKALAAWLDVPFLRLACNGTVAMLVALRHYGIAGGEVITTPYTFPATPHAIQWCGATPVFCDVDPVTGNLNPALVEAAITPDTQAILPVHVYGAPCDVVAFADIGRRHGIPIIYDAAHAFGVRYRNESLLQWGDLSVLSFHATKLFSTGEGGGIVSNDPAMHERLRLLKNFGIAGEEQVLLPGINGKLCEFQAAFGLAQLPLMESEIARRAVRADRYRDLLKGVPGLLLPPVLEQATPNHAYFVVRVQRDRFGMSRDDLYDLMRACNVIVRKYFYPTCNTYDMYRSLPSANPTRLPNATALSEEVLCLPLYGDLPSETVDAVAAVVTGAHHCAQARG